MPDSTTTVGLYLTLVGLLASFFWVSLSTWLRDLVELRASFRYWERQRGYPDQPQKLQQLSDRLEGLGDWTTAVTTLSVAAFVIFLLTRALDLASELKGSTANNLESTLWVFLFLYVILTGWLLGRGYTIVRSTAKGLDKAKT